MAEGGERPYISPKTLTGLPAVVQESAERQEVSKFKKPNRIIGVNIFPVNFFYLAIPLAENEDRVYVGKVKDIIASTLNIAATHSHFFGLFSGTLDQPIKLYVDDELLPEDVSHFSFMRLHFLFFRDEDRLQQDRPAEEIVFHEMIKQYIDYLVLPIPLGEIFYELKCMIRSKDVTGFWTTMNKHSRCVDSQGITIWQQGCLTDQGFSPLRVALDLSGMHFFCEDGRTLIMSWPWTTVTNIRIHTRPTMVFKFDILVKKNDDYYLRTIGVQTPSCEYILSVAQCILGVHKESISSGNSKLSLYEKHFQALEVKTKPYDLFIHPEMPLFVNCIKEKDIDGRKCELQVSLSNIAYAKPSGFYTARNIKEIPYPFEAVVHSYNVYYFSRKSVNPSNCNPNHMEDYITVKVIARPGDAVEAEAILLAAGRCLGLSNDSLDFFTVYTMKDGCRVRLLCNEDFVKPDDLNLCIRTLVFFWSKKLHNEQWEVLSRDERASQLLFWEVVAAHGNSIRDADLILNKFTHISRLLEVTFALGSIADVHSASDCVLVNKLTNIPNDGYLPGKKVILSLDAEGVHFWDHNNGQGILSWTWPEVSGLHKNMEPEASLTFRIYVTARKSKDYRNVEVATCSVSYLYSMSKLYLANFMHRQEFFRRWTNLLKKAKRQDRVKNRGNMPSCGAGNSKGKRTKSLGTALVEEKAEVTEANRTSCKGISEAGSLQEKASMKTNYSKQMGNLAEVAGKDNLDKSEVKKSAKISAPVIENSVPVDEKSVTVDENKTPASMDKETASMDEQPKSTLRDKKSAPVEKLDRHKEEMFDKAGVCVSSKGEVMISHPKKFGSGELRKSPGVRDLGVDLINTNRIVTQVHIPDCMTAYRDVVSFYNHPICKQTRKPPVYLTRAISLLTLASPTGNGRYFFTCLPQVTVSKELIKKTKLETIPEK